MDDIASVSGTAGGASLAFRPDHLSVDQVPIGALAEQMGIELIEISAERAVGRMPVEGNTQPVGLLHGGASGVLAETLGSLAAWFHGGGTKGAVGIELSVSHHASARSGWVTGTCTALKLGRRLASYEIAVADDAGRRLATARLTCMLVDPS